MTHRHGKRRERSRLDKNARIAIVGSGLAGLSAALSLEQAGFTNVTIYERDANVDARREGYGLTLTYNPKGPLAQMGILEALALQDCPSRSHYVFKPDGSILGYFGNAFMKHRGNGQRGNLRVPRKLVRRILMDRIRSSIMWDHRLVSWSSSMEDDTVSLKFQTGEEGTSREENVDLLVAADGLNSSIVSSLRPQDPSLFRYLDVMLVLGIADFEHPLLDERGFYCVDGSHRLFTMPYEGTRMDPLRRVMWQLSFPISESVARELCTSPVTLRDEVLRRCQTWHEPVIRMICATPLETIWGTPLMDRDPRDVLNLLERSRRVVVMGDALHPMSPFKGQGANQALLDGPLLVSWLQRASVDAAVRGFLRETVQRTSAKVQASREAAALLHSNAILQHQQHAFAGIKPEQIELLLTTLRSRNIGAALGAGLDDAVQQVIDDLKLGVPSNEPNGVQHEELSSEALAASRRGDTQGLRYLSMTSAAAIVRARTDGAQTCLHLAASEGHYDTCRWLLTEASVPHTVLDKQGLTALQVAHDDRVVNLLKQLHETE